MSHHHVHCICVPLLEWVTLNSVGTEKRYDYIWLKVNDQWLDQSNGRPTGRQSYEDNELSSKFGAECPGEWKSNEFGRFTFDVLRSELFTVQLALAMNYANDHMAITDLSISCAQRGVTEYDGVILHDIESNPIGHGAGGEIVDEQQAAGMMPKMQNVTLNLRPLTLISIWVIAIALAMNICWAFWCGLMKGKRMEHPDTIAAAAEGGSISLNEDADDDDDGMRKYGKRYPIPPLREKHIVPQPPPAMINVRV